jgi:uroporphyrinogen decarboxylase
VKIHKPDPNFYSFEKILKGEQKPNRVHFVEGVDREVIKYLMKNIFNRDFPYIEAERAKHQQIHSTRQSDEIIVTATEDEQAFLSSSIDFNYKVGLDYILDDRPNDYLISMLEPKVRVAKDTATLPRQMGTHGFNTAEGLRGWTEETCGIITTREDFEKYPWEKIKLNLNKHYDLMEKLIPNGMKVMLCFNYYGIIQDQFFGFQGLSYFLYDDPTLVREVADKWGEIILHYYKQGIEREFVGGIFHGDDFGHKTGTSINPQILRAVFFPWLTKFSALAHEHGKMFWLHSCGNLKDIMEDLINDIRIDAFHSFQDVILPVTEFKRKYQDKIATFGGVDMDKLIRLDETNLRKYIRYILERCMPGGRYALGSGNSISNYVPVKNFLIMLEEGRLWKCV